MGANPSAESIGSHRALLAIGANLGDRDATMRSALASLESDGVLRLIRRSAWYETAAVGGPPGQPPFLNGAAVVETKHDALFHVPFLQSPLDSLSQHSSTTLKG